MTPSEKLVTAIAYAELVHAHQTRADGRTPYIVHPVAVMRRYLAEFGPSTETGAIAAVLHDTLEDGKDPETVANTILDRFGRETYDLVSELTRPKTVPREQRIVYFSERVSTMSEQAVAIKLCDMLDNLGDIPTAPWSRGLKVRMASGCLDFSSAVGARVAKRSERMTDQPVDTLYGLATTLYGIAHRVVEMYR